jgi:hypothetical protein
VFVEDLIDDNSCPHCNEERYINNDNEKHTTAKCRINYKPIIPLLCLLISQPGFLLALNYKYQYGDNLQRNKFKFTDLSDGENYKKNLNEMKENFEAKYGDDNNDIINVMILLSMFYDGAQFSTFTVNLFLILYIILFQYNNIIYCRRQTIGHFLYQF